MLPLPTSTTTAPPATATFGIFAALAEFERELIRERTLAGLKAAGARGRRGGRKFALSEAQVRLARAAMAHRDTSVSALCRELGIQAGDALPQAGLPLPIFLLALTVRRQGPFERTSRDAGGPAAGRTSPRGLSSGVSQK